MGQQIVIPAAFRGPPASGNGGYVSGVLAECLREAEAGPDDAAVEVTLRAPIPLDTTMTLEQGTGGQFHLMLGEQLIAEAAYSELDLPVPAPPSFADALAAVVDSPSFYPNFNSLISDGTGFHPVCVCCGVDVAANEGLRVHAAPVAGFGGVAAAWVPHQAFVDERGYLPERIVWTALDCPGQFAYLAAGIRTGMLGRMTARVLNPVAATAQLLVIGWRMEIERRKHFAGTALFDGDGALCALARQTWIGRMD